MTKCEQCGKCCRYVFIDLDEPEEKVDWEEMRWFLTHKKVKIYKDEDGWGVEFITDCKYLINNKCSIYEKRPDVCRDHIPGECDNEEGTFDYELIFDNVEDFDKWLEKNKPKTHSK